MLSGDMEAHSSRTESQHISLSLALWTGQILSEENSVVVIVGLISVRLLCVEKHLSDAKGLSLMALVVGIELPHLWALLRRA